MEFIINSPQFKDINERYYARNRKLVEEAEEIGKKYGKAYDDLGKKLLQEKEQEENRIELEKALKEQETIMQNR